jgi:hypothetical protein
MLSSSLPSKGVAALLLLSLIGACWELYFDAFLTKCYLLSLRSQQPLWLCPVNDIFLTPSPLHSSPPSPLSISPTPFSPPWGVLNKEGQILDSVFIPPLYDLNAKSLSSLPQCFAFAPHQEGFLPASLSLQSPFHQSRWTLSYSGRLKYQPIWSGGDRTPSGIT